MLSARYSKHTFPMRSYSYAWVHLFLWQRGPEHLCLSVTLRHWGYQGAGSPCLMDRDCSDAEIRLGAHSKPGSFKVGTVSKCAW